MVANYGFLVIEHAPPGFTLVSDAAPLPVAVAQVAGLIARLDVVIGLLTLLAGQALVSREPATVQPTYSLADLLGFLPPGA